MNYASGSTARINRRSGCLPQRAPGFVLKPSAALRTLRHATASAIALLAIILTTPNSVVAETQWTIVAADTTGDVGRFCSIVVDAAGGPHVSYRESVSRSVWYSTSVSGVWTRELVWDDFVTSGSGTTTSIDVCSDGLVGVAYGAPGNGVVAYSERTSGSWDFVFADPPGLGAHSSLAFDTTGRFHVIYLKGSLLDRHLQGSLWVVDTLDATGGQWPSLKYGPNGNPLVAYYSGGGANAKFAEYDGADWSSTFIDTAGAVGLYSSLAVDSDGAPHVSYARSTPVFDLLYATRVGGMWQREAVDTAGTTGYYTSIATDADDNPWIAYTGLLGASTFAVKLATKSSGAWTITAIDTVASLERVSFAIDAFGRKHIAYYDASSGDLMYAIGLEPTEVAQPASVGRLLSLTVAPNPMVDESTRFALSGFERADARMSLYDVAGRHIRTLVAERSVGPVIALTWDGTDDRGRRVAAGVYVLRAEIGGSSATRRLVVVR